MLHNVKQGVGQATNLGHIFQRVPIADVKADDYEVVPVHGERVGCCVLAAGVPQVNSHSMASAFDFDLVMLERIRDIGLLFA